jgi:hypothetical protein
VIWFFERPPQTICLETRYDNDTNEYVAIVTDPDGRDTTERFADAESFRNWLTAWEATMEAERWRGTGTPVVVPDGWPRQRPVR